MNFKTENLIRNPLCIMNCALYKEEDMELKDILKILLVIYLVAANIAAVAVTIHDKRAAMKHQRRVPERTLLIAAALSGCVPMYITMRIIHHKTKHPKFMLGIPAIFVLEVIAGIVIALIVNGNAAGA